MLWDAHTGWESNRPHRSGRGGGESGGPEDKGALARSEPLEIKREDGAPKCMSLVPKRIRLVPERISLA